MELLRAIAALGDPTLRESQIAAIGNAIGARDLCVFMPDRDNTAKLIPAPGFRAPTPQSAGWDELLGRCAAPGVHAGRVTHPAVEAEAEAVAHAYPGVVFVVVGCPEPHQGFGEALDTIAPLVRALLEAEAAAERATRVKDELLAMLGHELRNPLAPIVTALQLMRLENIHTRAQDVLERQVDHLTRLVDDLLDVSRITRGKIELRKERVELSTVVTHAIEMSGPLLEQRRCELVVEVADHGLPLEVDPARLAQVLSNLITNAAKYSDREAPIRIAGYRDGDTIRIVVEDRGIGIDSTYLGRVFDQFVQAPQGIDRTSGGLGLGLAIVKSLVEMHGGRVYAESEGTGRGARFVVELPVANQPIPIPMETLVSDTERTRRMRSGADVLVVDDNRDAAELLAELLSTYGHRVQVAYDGPTALAALATFVPQVALLDIGLPVMDGYELADLLRERYPGIRLIALTGYGEAADRERSRAAGFAEHLVKPVSIASVTQTLDRVLMR
ncbi:MAG TPA: ATP-binding protein [Kofleriaceae bacterium]